MCLVQGCIDYIKFNFCGLLCISRRLHTRIVKLNMYDHMFIMLDVSFLCKDRCTLRSRKPKHNLPRIRLCLSCYYQEDVANDNAHSHRHHQMEIGETGIYILEVPFFKKENKMNWNVCTDINDRKHYKKSRLK